MGVKPQEVLDVRTAEAQNRFSVAQPDNRKRRCAPSGYVVTHP
jgi:hypothetical protein